MVRNTRVMMDNVPESLEIPTKKYLLSQFVKKGASAHEPVSFCSAVS